MFSVHTTPVNTVMKTSLFSKSSVIKTFSVHTKNAKSAFSDSSGGSCVFKLRLCDGIVWMVGLIVEVKLHFQILPAYCGRCVRVENVRLGPQ